MSSILSTVRSLFRDGTLPMPEYYGMNVEKNNRTRGSTLDVASPDFAAPAFVFDFAENPSNGDVFTINNLHVKMTLTYLDGSWKIKEHWVRPK